MSRYERMLAVERYMRCGGNVPESAYERRLRIENQIANTPPVYYETMEEYQWRIAREVWNREHPEGVVELPPQENDMERKRVK